MPRAVSGATTPADADPALSLAPSREPVPLLYLARLPSYPWLVVGAVCVGAFMGQLDASIA